VNAAKIIIQTRRLEAGQNDGEVSLGEVNATLLARTRAAARLRAIHRRKRNEEIAAVAWLELTNATRCKSGCQIHPRKTKKASGVNRWRDGPFYKVDRGGIEPPTHGFSVRCSTN
jgi:hypothetical protein